MHNDQSSQQVLSPSRQGSRLLVLALLSCCSFLLLSLVAHAHSTQSGKIKIGHVWADIATQHDGRIDVYLPIYNGGTAAETLVAVTSPEADKIVLVTAQGGEQAGVNLPLPPRKPLNLTARGPYLRLTGLTRAYQVGEEIPLTFQFTTTPPATIAAHIADQANH